MGMARHAWTGRRRYRLALDTLTVVLAAGGLVLVVVGGSLPSEPGRAADGRGDAAAAAAIPGPPSTGGVPSAPGTGAHGTTGPAPLGPSVPVRLDIPAIGVSTPLMPLGLNADGTVAVPPLRPDAPAGWYRHSATPGETGPAVILGHVDTASAGPAVFFRLRDLRPGDTVTVRRTDGTTAVFAVDRVAQYPKSEFPTGAVYGPIDHAALRLVTCGGVFDPIRREYRGNLVAYATLTATSA